MSKNNLAKVLDEKDNNITQPLIWTSKCYIYIQLIYFDLYIFTN